MTHDEIVARIRSILMERFDLPPTAVTERASIRGDLQLESLDVVDFITRVQKVFGFRAPMEAYRDVDTVGQLVTFVADHTGTG